MKRYKLGLLIAVNNQQKSLNHNNKSTANFILLMIKSQYYVWRLIPNVGDNSNVYAEDKNRKHE
jgi:hypothetical protein